MVDVVSRTTKQFLSSVSENETDFPAAQWIYQYPNWLDAVAGFPSKYWIITDDVITLMTPAQRAVVDAAEQAQEEQSGKDSATADVDEVASIGYNTRSLIETLNKRDNYNINRVLELQTQINSLRDAIRDSNGPADNIRAAAGAVDLDSMATNTRSKAETVQAYKDEIASGGADPV